jgi:hypothetical protein
VLLVGIGFVELIVLSIWEWEIARFLFSLEGWKCPSPPWDRDSQYLTVGRFWNKHSTMGGASTRVIGFRLQRALWCFNLLTGLLLPQEPFSASS